MSYAFTFDASSCSGCKACQAACKDKNDLSPGVLWRRVFEISGGEWIQTGDSWVNSVFAYNFSMACNHCVHPKCAGVCPTNAYHVREDGFVFLDSAKCVGCGYCNWACPYAVPQYDHWVGSMSKCNFCVDLIDAGEEPACVAACPMRVLGFAEVGESASGNVGFSLWTMPGTEHPFPLPEFSRTQPHILLKPHPAMTNSLKKVVANREEVRPGKDKSEFPLVAFTLLVQMSIGSFWLERWLFANNWTLVEPATFNLGFILVAFNGLALLLGLLVAFMHLGTKRNAWRMLHNLKKSWLSKEILFMGIFGLSLLSSALIYVPFMDWLTALLGLGLIYSMANVYYLRSLPGWNTWRTLAAFLLSALLLGLFLLIPILLYASYLTGFRLLSVGFISWIGLFSTPALVCELLLLFSVKWENLHMTNSVRVALILLVMVGAIIASQLPASIQGLSFCILFLLLLTEESIGRWHFYGQLSKRNL